MKRDDQILPLRLLQEDRRNRLTTQAKDKDRARAQEIEAGDGDAMELDEKEDEGAAEEEGETAEDQDAKGTKVIVIHLGSQNLRIGLASDAIPKSSPMVIARKWRCNESEEGAGEPSPKRQKLEDGSYPEPEKMFGQEVLAMLCSPESLLTWTSLQHSIVRCAQI